MPEFTSYPPGIPCWVDLSTPGVSNSQVFYCVSFGWEVGDTGPEGGGYAMFLKQGSTWPAWDHCRPTHRRGPPTSASTTPMPPPTR